MVLTALSVSTLFTFALVPLGVLCALAVTLIPCLLVPGVKIGAAMKALYCYAMQTLGIALMTLGAAPAVYGVLEKLTTGIEQFSAEMYLALLIMFSCGGITFLWYEQIAERIDDTSRRVPAMLFWYTFKGIGYVLLLLGVLSFVVTMLLSHPLEQSWWISPLVIALYGLLLCWCTRWPSTKPETFHSIPMNGMKMAHAGKKKR